MRYRNLVCCGGSVSLLGLGREIEGLEVLLFIEKYWVENEEMSIRL